MDTPRAVNFDGEGGGEEAEAIGRMGTFVWDLLRRVAAMAADRTPTSGRTGL